MLIVGLTGGIGSGKSTVARMLADRGAVVIDVDGVGREVIAAGGRATPAVLAEFGDAVAGSDGGVDRGALAGLVFADPGALARLSAISHPSINAELADRLDRLPDDSIVVLDMAILVESNLGKLADGRSYERVVTVEAPIELRIDRAVARGMNRADVEARLRAQASDEARAQVADAVVTNDGTLEQLTEQVDLLWLRMNGWSHKGYCIDLIALDGTGRVEFGDRLIAESSHCLIVREPDHLDQLYFPIEDVIAELIPSEHRTTCPFKGVASYWSIATADGALDDAVWGYRPPFDEVSGIASYVAFYTDRVRVTANVPFGDGSEATTRFPCWGTETDLLRIMTPSAVDDARDTAARLFRTPLFPEQPLGTYFGWARKLRNRNVIEGGQQLGAVIAAAGQTHPDVPVTWATIVFTKAAHWDTPLNIELDVRHQGRSVVATDARVLQDGVLRATASVMGDRGSSDLITHAIPMPEVPAPADCPSHDFGVIGRDFRVVDGAYQDQHTAGPPVLYVWTRFSRDPGERWLHQAAFAQSSTHWSIAAALRPYADISEADAHDTISNGPLTVALAFHDELDVTEWLLTETQSIYAGHGSTQSQTRTFTRDGRLVASSMVQAMVRPFASTEGAVHDPSTAM